MLAVSSIRKFLLTELLSFRHGFAVPLLAAARSPRGSGMPQACHSLPRGRFATSQRKVLKPRTIQGLPCVREAVSRRLREGLFSRQRREFQSVPQGTPVYIIHYSPFTVHYSLADTACTRGVGDAAPYKHRSIVPAAAG